MKKEILALLCCLLFAAPGAAVKQEGRVTQADERAIALAIEDEVYDRGQQGYFADIGDDIAGEHSHVINFYIEPYITGGIAYVIYKFMPYGEVYRVFWIRDDGLAVLDGDPDNGFPPSQPNHLTVYGDDNTLCKQKHEWLKFRFVVDWKPSKERIAQAVARQKKRTGHSVREEKPQ